MHAIFRNAAALALALAPEAARACAACGFGEDESRSAYIGTTIALSLLPLALIATFALWLRRAHRRRAAEGVDGGQA